MNAIKCMSALGVAVFMFVNVSARAQEAQDRELASYEAQYHIAKRNYDVVLAAGLSEQIGAEVSPSSPEQYRWIAVKTFLLVAELNRIRFEETPESDRRTRRELGRQIDEAADQGLAHIAELPEVSEKYRLNADLLGTRIRTRFHAKKFRKKMENAIERARELDDTNALALVSAAKPFLFAGERHGGDIERAVELLDRALRIDSNNERALVLRGFAYKELGRTDLADGDWEQALENNPHCAPARYGLEHK